MEGCEELSELIVFFMFTHQSLTVQRLELCICWCLHPRLSSLCDLNAMPVYRTRG